MKEIILLTLLGPSPVLARVPTGEEWKRMLAHRRAKNIERLHAYAKQGFFPQNTYHPDKLTPYFVSVNPCAVAWLMISSGKKHVVDELARTNNNVYVSELKDGPVVDWIVSSGLLQEEAARVQPQYRKPRPGDAERKAARMREIKRVRDHLYGVEEELRANTQKSLAEAARRLEARVKADPAYGEKTLEEWRAEAKREEDGKRWVEEQKARERARQEEIRKRVKFER